MDSLAEAPLLQTVLASLWLSFSVWQTLDVHTFSLLTMLNYCSTKNWSRRPDQLTWPSSKRIHLKHCLRFTFFTSSRSVPQARATGES